MILVTGGTGLVGSQILFDIVKSGKKVRALKRADSDLYFARRLFSSQEDFSKIEWIEGDVMDIFSLEEALEGIETVIHSAAFVSFYRSDRKKMLKTNGEGTANMVNMALKKNVKRFCHLSSTAALGRMADEKYLDENSWWKTSPQNSNYAISKYAGEREVWRGMEEGLPAFILNPSIIIGPGNWTSGSTQMFSQVWKGLSFYTNGKSGFVDVRDVSKAALLLVEKGITNERFIINSENLSYREVFDMVAVGLGKKKATMRVTPFLAEMGWRAEMLRGLFSKHKPMLTKETARNSLMQWNYSNEKIKKEIGIDFISIEKSVKDACEYFLRDAKNKI